MLSRERRDVLVRLKSLSDPGCQSLFLGQILVLRPVTIGRRTSDPLASLR